MCRESVLRAEHMGVEQAGAQGERGQGEEQQALQLRQVGRPQALERRPFPKAEQRRGQDGGGQGEQLGRQGKAQQEGIERGQPDQQEQAEA